MSIQKKIEALPPKALVLLFLTGILLLVTFASNIAVWLPHWNKAKYENSLFLVVEKDHFRTGGRTLSNPRPIYRGLIDKENEILFCDDLAQEAELKIQPLIGTSIPIPVLYNPQGSKVIFANKTARVLPADYFHRNDIFEPAKFSALTTAPFLISLGYSFILLRKNRTTS